MASLIWPLKTLSQKELLSSSVLTWTVSIFIKNSSVA